MKMTECKDCGTNCCSDDPNECEHPETKTRGDYDYCVCCGEQLGEWRTNNEFYDTIGAPYDDDY
jgi:hypothetical protein